MMRASIDHAMEDMADRETIELRNKAAAMVHGTRRALELSDLPPDQTYAVKKATNKVDRLLADADTPADELKRAVDDLSRRTAQIADDVIGSAVQKALTEPREPESR